MAEQIMVPLQDAVASTRGLLRELTSTERELTLRLNQLNKASK
jgi:hypothetical protein